MFEQYPDVLTLNDLMQILMVKKELLHTLIRTEQLPVYRIGKKSWRCNKQSLISYLIALEKNIVI